MEEEQIWTLARVCVCESESDKKSENGEGSRKINSRFSWQAEKQATNKQAEPVSREPFVIKERRGKCAVFGNWEMLPHGNLLSMGSNCYRKAALERFGATLGVFAFSIDSSRWFDAPLTRTWDRKLCTNACREDTRHRWYMCFIGNQTGAKITGPSIDGFV